MSPRAAAINLSQQKVCYQNSRTLPGRRLLLRAPSHDMQPAMLCHNPPASLSP